MAFLLPSLRSSVASSSSRSLLRPAFLAPGAPAAPPPPSSVLQARGIKFAPKRTKYGMNAFKGRVPIHTGGSTKGSTLSHGGEFGIRATNGVRIKAKQLEAAYEAIRRKLKPFKGVDIIMRVFPDIPVTAKGAQARMGKGKGAFDFWACRVPMNHAIFELRGGNLRIEIARDALRVASAKLPVGTQFITPETLPRVGSVDKPFTGALAKQRMIVEDLTPLSPEEVAAEERAALEESAAERVDGAQAAQPDSGVQRFTRPVRIAEKIRALPPGTKIGYASGQKVMIPL